MGTSVAVIPAVQVLLGFCNDGGCFTFLPCVLMLRWLLTPCPLMPVTTRHGHAPRGGPAGSSRRGERVKVSHVRSYRGVFGAKRPGGFNVEAHQRRQRKRLFAGRWSLTGEVSAVQPTGRQLAADLSLHRPRGRHRPQPAPGACGNLKGSMDAPAPLRTAQNLVFPF